MEGPMPVAFTAHGNPMNALGGNPFARFLARWGESLPRPQAVLCVSAHWERSPLAVTASERPETVHDFYGFPPELYRLRYPAPGSPALAARTRQLLVAAGFLCQEEQSRGLDHGVWSPLMHLLPGCDVPVVQLSLPRGVPMSAHVEIGRTLAPLRDEGVLILGSGNLVHNLIAADLRDREAPVAAWALRFDGWVKQCLQEWNLEALSTPWEAGPAGRDAHPTLEHYAPLLVVCGAADPERRVAFPFEGFEHGSLSMRCVQLS